MVALKCILRFIGSKYESEGKEVGSMEQGTVIFLNGTSSAGKSSIAKILQETMDGYFIHTGIDHFIERLPPKFFAWHVGLDPPPAVGELWISEKGDGRLTEIRVGPVGYRVLAGIYQ